MVPQRGFIDWLFETWSWLVHNHDADLRARHLVLPTHDDFPVDRNLRGSELAEDYFLFVHEHAGLEGWPLHVLPHHAFLRGTSEADEGVVGAATAAGETQAEGVETRSRPRRRQSRSTRGATDSIDTGFPIPYDPAHVTEPARLVASFGRGVSHYVVQSICSAPPGDLEYVVDLCSVYLGFGVFCANAAGSHERAPFYLRSQPLGAMAEHEFAYALAVFGILLEIPDTHLERHLRPNPRVFHRKAVKHILRHHALGLERLRGTFPRGVGPYR